MSLALMINGRKNHPTLLGISVKAMTTQHVCLLNTNHIVRGYMQIEFLPILYLQRNEPVPVCYISICNLTKCLVLQMFAVMINKKSLHTFNFVNFYLDLDSFTSNCTIVTDQANILVHQSNIYLFRHFQQLNLFGFPFVTRI